MRVATGLTILILAGCGGMETEPLDPQSGKAELEPVELRTSGYKLKLDKTEQFVLVNPETHYFILQVPEVGDWKRAFHMSVWGDDFEEHSHLDDFVYGWMPLGDEGYEQARENIQQVMEQCERDEVNPDPGLTCGRLHMGNSEYALHRRYLGNFDPGTKILIALKTESVEENLVFTFKYKMAVSETLRRRDESGGYVFLGMASSDNMAHATLDIPKLDMVGDGIPAQGETLRFMDGPTPLYESSPIKILKDAFTLNNSCEDGDCRVRLWEGLWGVVNGGGYFEVDSCEIFPASYLLSTLNVVNFKGLNFVFCKGDVL